MLAFLFAFLSLTIFISPALAGEPVAEEDYVTILVVEGTKEVTSSGLILHSYVPTEGKVPTSALAKEFCAFMRKMKSIVSTIPADSGGFAVDEIELNLALNAEGGFSLIGKASAGMTTGIKVTLRRRH